jgi:NDP-sugar pyrophosphorylase family protein
VLSDFCDFADQRVRLREIYGGVTSVGFGAVLIISSRNRRFADIAVSSSAQPVSHSGIAGAPLECAEICGRTLVERIIERYAAIDCDSISILVEAGIFLPRFRSEHVNVSIETVNDLRPAVTRKLDEYLEQGIDHAFIQWADTYTETDLLDVFCFHRESKQMVTPTFDGNGALALWVVNCEKAQGAPLETLLQQAGRSSRYFIREFVTRLTHPRSMREFAADMLRGRCETGPSGRQTRPGIWCDEDADVHRRARLVAPAYIGCGAKVRADALITRFSNIERECCIDSGTVVEDSCILAYTTIGICLDLSHAVVNGNELFNLERDVAIEISDPKVMKSTATVHKLLFTATEPIEPIENEVVEKDHKLSKLHPMSQGWQLNGSLIQE